MKIQARTKRQCALCLTACGLGLKRIALMLGTVHPLVARWRKSVGISGMIGPRMGNGVLKGSKAYRPQKSQEEAFRSEQSACRMVYGRMEWIRHPDCARHESAARARRYYPFQSNEQRIKRAIRFRVWKVCKLHGSYKSARTEELTGADGPTLIKHLESRFTKGMTWQNYGTVWEVDHIAPCFMFDLSKPEEQRRCFHYSNLRPLGVTANRSRPKSAKTPQQVGLGI